MNKKILFIPLIFISLVFVPKVGIADNTYGVEEGEILNFKMDLFQYNESMQLPEFFPYYMREGETFQIEITNISDHGVKAVFHYNGTTGEERWIIYTGPELYFLAPEWVYDNNQTKWDENYELACSNAENQEYLTENGFESIDVSYKNSIISLTQVYPDRIQTMDINTQKGITTKMEMECLESCSIQVHWRIINTDGYGGTTTSPGFDIVVLMIIPIFIAFRRIKK